MKTVLRWVLGNLPLVVLALVLALLAWVVAAEEQDPTRTERYPYPVPIRPSGIPEDLVLVGELDETVEVTIRAPESVWQTIEIGDLTATVDLAAFDSGRHQVPVRVVLRKQPAYVTWEPASLTLELAPRAEQSVPVHVQVEGEPAVGYLTQPAVTAPQQVTVSGPSTYVAQVVEAITPVSVQNANANVKGEFPLRAVDREGQPVPYVSLVPQVATVDVPIAVSGFYRTLTVRVIYDGRPAAGYHITYISVEPPMVTVRGSPDVIAALPGYIETEPIDVDGIQARLVSQPALNVPADVTIVSDQQVTVEIFVEAVQSSLPMEITPTLQGLGPGLAATISPGVIEVFLSGPLSQLEALTDVDVRIVLDLFDLPRGTHQVEPQVIVPAGLTALSILPTTVQVEIVTANAEPTNTPVPGK